MSDPCWTPGDTPTPGWEGDGKSAWNRWTPGAQSDSTVCRAIACLVVACGPFERDDLWQNDGEGTVPVCEG